MLNPATVARREEVKKLFKNPFAVGDIIHHSWGYDQTQCDYYQVVAITDKSVALRKIAGKTVPGSEGSMCCSLLPEKDHFLEGRVHQCIAEGYDESNVKPTWKVVKAHFEHSGELRYFIPTRHGWAEKWDGKPNYESWYA